MGESFQQSMKQEVKKKQTSKHAIAALILALFGIFIFFLMPVAIVLGHVGRSKCKEDPGLGGKGLATGALVIGYAYFTIAIGIVCMVFFGPDRMHKDALPEESRIEIETISLEDPVLEACIKKYATSTNEYFDAPVYMDEIDSIVCDCSDRKIRGLDGVEDLINLDMLVIECHAISDLTPLKTLKYLDHVEISSGELIDPSPLSHLERLGRLELYDNRIKDISSLADIPGLYHLGLDGNQIEDLSPLAALTELIDLSLKGNNITDISALAALGKLEKLDVSDNRIRDVRPLQQLPLTDFRISGNSEVKCEDLIGFKHVKMPKRCN